MNTYTPLAAALAMAAVGAPMVCQAQDPATAFKEVTNLRAMNRNEDALKLTENMLKMYGSPTSRLAKQFGHFTPFFYWQKGEILTTLGRYDEAFATFKELNTKPEFKQPAMITRSKELPGWKADGYLPLVSASLFQMGNLLYKQASEGSGNPAKYEECIPLLEEYLKLYEGNKVTKWERDKKIDGTVCFLLLQSYLLKPEPNFEKAGVYMEKQRKSKATLPDDMVFGGLNTVLDIALKEPKYIEWGEKMISANPSSLRLSPDRLATYVPGMFNYGVKAVKLWEDALYAGDMKQAQAAARTVYSLLSLVPDSGECVEALGAVAKSMGSVNSPLLDRGTGVKVNPERIKKLESVFAEMVSNHAELEAYATFTLANTAGKMGSARLAKAGYKVLIDRYPNLRQKKGDSWTELRDLNYLQYVQFARMTGDENTAREYEDKIDAKNVGDGNKNAIVLSKMNTLMKEEKWEQALPVIDEALEALKGEPDSANYISVKYSRVAVLYKLGKMEQVVADGEAMLSSDVLKPGALTEEQARSYKTQLYFFLVDACKDIGISKPEFLDKSLTHAEAFMKEFPSVDLKVNRMAPNVYFDAIFVLLRRASLSTGDAGSADSQKALRYCDYITRNWPENELYPTVRQLAANIIINGNDDAVKPQAIDAYEEAATAGLKQGSDRGKLVAVESLYKLANYAPEYDREGEDAKAKAARIAGYFNTFWKEADYEGNPYALQMSALQLSRALASRDEESYNTCLKHSQQIIAREAGYAFKNNEQNEELEPTINSYVIDYVDGYKAFKKKDLTLDEKSAHLESFPGIAKEDKYTNAILHMALLTSMEEAMSSAKRGGNTERANELERDIARSFRKMRDQFKPEDLTNFICVRVGNYEVDYARRLPAGSARQEELNMALKYFAQVLERKGDMQNEAQLGKANALALSSDSAAGKEALALYTKLAGNTNPAVAGPALRGLTDLNMSMKNYKAAVESANRYMGVRNGGTPAERTNMQLKLAEAFCESGEVEKGLQSYLNVFLHNRGNITVSAPACKAMMEQYWKRNNPSAGDRIKGKFTPSDRWTAWHTGQDYVRQIRASKIEEKMTPSQRDLFNEVVVLLDQYSKDAAVQKEEKERLDYQSMIRK